MVKRKMEIKDLRKFKFVSDPQISHDGTKIAFVYSTINYEEDKYERHIWMTDTSTGESSQFTYGSGADTYPRWSPDDSKLIFLSRGREPNKTQLYTIKANGGEAKMLAESEEGLGSMQWSSDSKSVMYISKVWTEEKPETDVKTVSRIKYKLNAAGFFEGRRNHIFVVQEGRKPKQLTDGEYDVEYAAWNPNRKEIAFVTNMSPDQDTSRVRDIFKVPVKGGEPIKVTNGGYAIGNLAYSPSGEALAFIGYDRVDEYAVDYDLYTLPAEGGDIICLTEGFNRSLGMGIGSDLRVSTPSSDPVWSHDGEHIYFLTTDIPFCNLYRVGVASQRTEMIKTGMTIDGYSVSDDGAKIAFNAMSAIEPCELYLLEGEATKKLTEFNRKLLDQIEVLKSEHFTFQNRLGRMVDGWILKPSGWKEGLKYPCILEMHGGPRGAYGDGVFHEFQVLASNGWVVIYTNPRGSSGYEESYTTAVMGHYGEVDYEDFMDFTDESIRRFPWIDPDRLGLTGGSYGGYMTNWIITQTDRFRCAVTFRSICNWVSKFGVSDIGFMQPETISGEKSYWGPALVEQMKHSPLYYVDRVKTPCLIIHSEQDYRCPIEQGEQWFTALKLNGVPTKLMRFPDENHELSRSGKPKHREERLQHLVEWFKEYI